MGKCVLFRITLIVLLFSSLCSSGQHIITPDSLINCLHKAGSGLEKAEIEMKISKYYLGVFPDSVEPHANNAISIFKSHKLPGKTVDATLILAQSYKYQGLFDQAIYCIKGLISEIKKENDELLLGKCYHFMGEFCRATHLFESSLVYLQDGLKIAHKIHNDQLAANCYDRMAAVYFEKRELGRATNYADSAIHTAKKIPDYEVLTTSLDILGAIYSVMGQYDKALSIQFQSLEACAKMDEPESILPNINRNIANTYFILGDTKKALEFATLSYEMADKSKIWVYMESSAGLLTKIYAKLGKYKQAYEFSEISKGIKTYRADKEITYKISEINGRYESVKKERLIAEQNQELYLNQLQMLKDRTRLHVLVTGLITLITIVIVLFLIYFQKRRNYRQSILQNQLILEKNAEMEQLTKEITLQSDELRKSNEQLKKLNLFKIFMTNMMVHDLKNPLNSIIGFSEFHPDDPHFQFISHSAKGMLQMVSNILDIQKYERSEMQVMKQRQPVIIAFNKAIDEVKIALEMRRLKVSFQIDPGCEANFDSEIINRVLINLLTNAVKYSFEDNVITISGSKEIMRDKFYVRISVHNLGEVIPNDKLEQIFEEFSDVNSRKLGESYSTGIGLTFCRMAVKAHNGEIGVESADKMGTTFWFTLEA